MEKVSVSQCMPEKLKQVSNIQHNAFLRVHEIAMKLHEVFCLFLIVHDVACVGR